MPTLHTKRVIVVVRADLAARANTAFSKPDTDETGGGASTFTAGLSATGTAPATAFWCNGAFKPAQALAIRTRLQEQGATVAETTPIVFGQTPASNRFALFDLADGWTSQTVLQAVGLTPVQPVTP